MLRSRLARLIGVARVTILILLCGSAASRAEQNLAAGVVRTNLAGIDVLAYPASVEQVVTLRGSLPAGRIYNPADNPMIATLVAAMLDKGTRARDKFALARELDDVGASISFASGSHVVDFTARCLRQDLPLVLLLLAEQLRSPAFAASELTKLKAQLSGELRRELEDTGARANEAFVRAVYPVGHPNHMASIEERLAGLEAARVEELRAFHSRYYHPANLTLVAVGDLDVPALHAQVQKSFGTWASEARHVTSPRLTRTPALLPPPLEQTIFVPGKASVSLAIGQSTGLTYREPDALALRLATSVLGSGFTGRLMANVRDKEGLTYGIGAGLANDTFADGDWRISATFAPALLDAGIAATKRQLVTWHEQGISADELAARKSALIGQHRVGLATTAGLADALLVAVQRGYGVSWLDEYSRAVEALTLEQVNAAIRRHLDPGKMVWVKAGTLHASAQPPTRDAP